MAPIQMRDSVKTGRSTGDLRGQVFGEDNTARISHVA